MTADESLQAAIDESVSLVAYDARWPSIFAAEQARLASLFPREMPAIEHIGSTAIPGLRAKPVIDLLAGVESMAVAEALVAPLCAAGYATSAEFNASLPDRRWLMRWADGRRTHHLHVVVQGSPAWTERLAFRDRLRESPTLAALYAGLKSRLAGEHAEDREAYTAAKGGFVRAVLEGTSPDA